MAKRLIPGDKVRHGDGPSWTVTETIVSQHGYHVPLALITRDRVAGTLDTVADAAHVPWSALTLC